MSDLHRRAEQIRDERGVGRNTNTRVGQLLMDVISGHETDVVALTKKLQTKVDGAYVEGGFLYLTSGDNAIAGPFEMGSQDVVNQIKGQLENKIDGAYTEDGALYLTSGNEIIAGPIEVGSGTGSGSSSGVLMKLKNLTGSVLSVAAGTNAVLSYSFTSVDTSDNSETGEGTVQYTINGAVVLTENISQGEHTVDITRFLRVAANTVRMKVTDSYGTARTLTWTVNVVSVELTSTFDDTQIYSSNVIFRYTPKGDGEKRVHFVLDGVEQDTVTTSSSNRQLSKVFSGLSNGAHKLKVYMVAVVGGMNIRSNELFYEFIYADAHSDRPVIVSSFDETKEVEQYSVLSIPYLVYDPGAERATVLLKANNVTVAELEVGRTKQLWSYQPLHAGALVLSIVCGGVEKVMNIIVKESETGIYEETENLQVRFSSAGRSNADINRSVWESNGIYAQFTGMNWATDGWQIDEEGSVYLRLFGEAKTTFRFTPFDSNFIDSGKTITFEYATSEVNDVDAIIAQCVYNGVGIVITPHKVRMASNQSVMEANVASEGQKVSVSFIVEKRVENRLMYLFVDGILSSVMQYSTSDNFMQSTPQYITIGSTGATLHFYGLRVYLNNLNYEQVLSNYIFDWGSYEKKLQVFDRNNIADSFGGIVYEKLISHLPCMTITGELPTYKGDKQVNIVTYENRQDPAKNFTTTVKNDVQGTSSQYYPRKNYKWKATNGFTNPETGQVSEKYALRDGAIPVDCFCLKADFAESSGTHNTGMAKIIHRILTEMEFFTPPQINNDKVRTTVDGFPIALFWKETLTSETVFLGKYNFNNDKSTEETFGFVPGAECWEFCNNTSGRVLFTQSDYEAKTGDFPDWMNDFEARYPDDDMLNSEYKAGKIPERLKRLTDWIVSTKDNPEKFKTECAQYFNIDFLLSYYVITEFFGMIDQRAKNMFFATWDGTLWYPIFYDNDTCLGINNEGRIAFGFNMEYHDVEGSQNVWNGETSVLWNNVETAFASEVKKLYYDMRQKKVLTFEKVREVLTDEQAARWCERVYNEDGQYKYIVPLINDGNGSYLYAAQGSRVKHREWWLKHRFAYMDSKYVAGDFFSNYATMRLYKPTEWTGVQPSFDFDITLLKDSYVRVKYGSYIADTRGVHNETLRVVAPDMEFNDTETIIYGIQSIKSLGNLASKYAGSVDLSSAISLTELLLGSSEEGYENSNLTDLHLGNNLMLKKIDLQNCVNLKQPLDVSGCISLEELNAEGTQITSVEFPPQGGNMKIVKLPDTLSSLIVNNQKSIEVFSLAGAQNLVTLSTDGSINGYAVAKRSLASDNPLLQTVRLENVYATDDDLKVIGKILDMSGMDELGNYVEKSIVSGKLHVTTALSSILNRVKERWPKLTVTYNLLSNVIEFADPKTKAICIANWDADGDGELSSEEAKALDYQSATALSEAFRGSDIEYFNEFAYFTKIMDTVDSPAIPFIDCLSLKEIGAPDGYVKTLFRNCPNLKKVTFGKFSKLWSAPVFKEVIHGVDFIVPDDSTYFFVDPTKSFIYYKESNALKILVFLKDSLDTVTVSADSLGWKQYVRIDEYALCNSLTLKNLAVEAQQSGPVYAHSCDTLETITLKGDARYTPCADNCPKLRTIDASKVNGITFSFHARIENCPLLESLKLPINEDVPFTMTNSVYINAPSLKEIDFGAKLTQFYGRGITLHPTEGCVIFRNTTVPVMKDVYVSEFLVQRIYVLDSMVDAFKSATGWKNFAVRIYPLSQKNN